MKKKLILITCILFPSYSFSQQKSNGIITYEISLNQPDLTTLDKNKKLSKEGKNKIIDYFKNTENVIGVLKFADIKSIYKLKEKGLINEGVKKLNITRGLAKGDDIFYHNFKTKKIIRVTNFGKLFLIQRKPLKWQLTQESKKIGRYTCFKAIYQYHSIYVKKPSKPTIVWYTMDIPVRFGPEKYAGLPGLVIRGEDNVLTYNATNIVLNPKEKIIIKEPKKGVKITEEEFKANMNNSFDKITKKKRN